MSGRYDDYDSPYYDRYDLQRPRMPDELEELIVAGRGLDEKTITALLEFGEIVDTQLSPWSSNYTFYVGIKNESARGLAVYKPSRGETPLWDFPGGTLCLREYASFLVSRALGWNFIPLTVLREGPHGLGSLQWYIDADPEENYFTFREQRVVELKRIAAFDFLTNNADRKGGHCLLGRDDKIWAIDHGLTFHVAPKLRTVIWDFQGEAVPDDLMADLDSLRGELKPGATLFDQLSNLIAGEEMRALELRLEVLLKSRSFPYPGPHRSVPWPPV